ncbi:MAG: PEP-CTERM sorting domain-containing protein [Longimicrobiales bacterium]
MKRLLLIALSVGLLAQPAQLTAQQPYLYNGVPDATEYMTFLGGSGVNGGYGVQVGPYLGRFEYPASASFSIYCVDYNHYAKSQWVDVTGIGPVGDLSQTRLNDFGKYQQAAYLASLFDTAPTTSWGGIHAAIWSLTSGVSVGDVTQRNYYLGLAAANGSSFDTSGWYVLSPQSLTSSTGGQEFLMRTKVSVPEPAAFLLMATGLLLLAGVSRKRVIGFKEGDA